MKHIEKKTTPEFFQDIFDGKKGFEIRLADWKCQPGDILVLKEWDPKTKEYTGRVMKKEIKYILKTKDLNFFTDEEVERFGFQVIGFK